MRHDKQTVLFWLGLSAAVLFAFFLSGSDALAAENAENWRTIYDLLMRWVNFAVIVILLVKFAKAPLKNFLLGRKEQVERNIKEFEQQKDAVEKQIIETQDMLAHSMIRFENIKKTIIDEGERQKLLIIEDARQESRILLQATQHKIEHQIREARHAIRSELIDAASALAEERISAEITAADQQKLTDLFLANTAGR